MSVKARRVPNVKNEIVDDWYGSIVDKEWDEYEVGSSFLVEEPYSKRNHVQENLVQTQKFIGQLILMRCSNGLSMCRM